MAIICLEGIVLHSPDIDRLSAFYGSLLGITFRENISQNRRHFVGELNDGPEIYLYPMHNTEQSAPNQHSAQVRIDTPSLVFQAGNIDSVLKAIEAYTHGNVKKNPNGTGVGIYDPDGRAIYLHNIR